MSSSGTEGPAPNGAVATEQCEVSMPKMGISVSEGTILEWRKQPGDWVEADETLADVTTDKVDVEIPSPASGRLAKVVAEPGDTVPVGEPIAVIDPGATAGEAHPDESPPDERPAPGGRDRLAPRPDRVRASSHRS